MFSVAATVIGFLMLVLIPLASYRVVSYSPYRFSSAEGMLLAVAVGAIGTMGGVVILYTLALILYA